MRRLEIAAMMIAVSALACASNAPSRPEKQTTVNFDMTLEPAVVHIGEGETVGWVSTGDYSGVVSFPIAIESSFTCTNLDPIFTRDGDHLVSVPIVGQMESVVLPCPLKPGVYDYTIGLSQAGAGALVGEESLDTMLTLDGKIIVEGAASP